MHIACILFEVSPLKGMALERGANFIQSASNVTFMNCKASADGNGGGLAVLKGHLHQFSGSLSFDGCSSGVGGGLFVGGDVQMVGDGAMRFQKCDALQEGSECS